MLFDPNFKPPDLRPKITVVVIPRDEKSRINALRRARGRTLNPSMHFYVAPPSR